MRPLKASVDERPRGLQPVVSNGDMIQLTGFSSVAAFEPRKRRRAARRRPRIRLAGRGDEPVEGQVYVVAGAGVMLAHDLNVIVDREGIAVRPLAEGAPVRFVQAAAPADQRAPAARAMLELLRELGRAHARRLATA